MAYTKTTWASGDLITATGLNNIENGIEALDTDTVRISAQTLTDVQKEQILSNIGASSMMSDEAKALMEGLADQVIVTTDHHRSSGQAAYISLGIHTGDLVYIYTEVPDDVPYRVYLADGTVPHPQNSEKLTGTHMYTFFAKKDYNQIAYWFNVAPATFKATVYLNRKNKAARQADMIKPIKSVVFSDEGTTKTSYFPFQVLKGETIHVNVSNVVATDYTGIAVAFSNDRSVLAQSTALSGSGMVSLVAENDYDYVAVWYECTKKTSSTVSICVDSEKSNYKTYSVIGDSYSAYAGYIPSGNVTSYPISGNDVDSVDQMWWKRFADQNHMTLELNDSYTGTSVCNYAYNKDQSAKSFVTRIKNLPESDVIFVFGGTNDAWGTADLGDYVYSGWTAAQLNQFRPAYAYILNWLRVNRPGSDVVAIINCDIDENFQISMKTIAEHYNVPVIQLANVAKTDGHPSIAGMAEIGAQVEAVLMTRKVSSHDYDGSLRAVSEQLAALQAQLAEVQSELVVGTVAEAKSYLNIT